MLEKFLSRSISIFLYLGAFMFFLAFIGSFTGGTFSKITSLIFLAISVILVIVGRKVWNVTKPKNSKLNNTVDTSKPKVSTSSFTITDVPPEILEDMKQYYPNMQLQNDLRILQESVELMKSTKNIETFISRADLAQRTALTIEQAIMAGISVKEKFISSKEFRNLKTDLLPILLNETYLEMKQNASKLKTEKGKIGRYQKYLDLLQKYEDELSISESYFDVLESVKSDLHLPYTTKNS